MQQGSLSRFLPNVIPRMNGLHRIIADKRTGAGALHFMLYYAREKSGEANYNDQLAVHGQHVTFR